MFSWVVLCDHAYIKSLMFQHLPGSKGIHNVVEKDMHCCTPVVKVSSMVAPEKKKGAMHCSPVWLLVILLH